MNIDLLFTEKGEAGLISNENLARKVAGIVYDPQSGLFTLEFADMDYLDFNIPVEASYNPYIDLNEYLHVGSVKKGHIGQAYQVPLMFSDDPYRNQHNPGDGPENPLESFSAFVRGVVAGQPVHRDDLGDEDSLGCVLGDASPAALEFAPHLARRHGLEAKPVIAPINAPGMGLGGGGGGGATAGGGGRSSSGTSNHSARTAKGSKDSKGSKK